LVVLFADVWGMRGLLRKYTTKGLEQGLAGVLATWKSFPYAQSTTEALRASMGLEPRASPSIGGLMRMICSMTPYFCSKTTDSDFFAKLGKTPTHKLNFQLRFQPLQRRRVTEKEVQMNAITTTEVQALVESLTSDIDALYVLDQQAKVLAKQVEAMKDAIANKYGECAKDANGDDIPHKGELHSVVVKLISVKGTVDYKKLCIAYNIQDDVLDTFRKEARADIRVTPSK